MNDTLVVGGAEGLRRAIRLGAERDTSWPETGVFPTVLTPRKTPFLMGPGCERVRLRSGNSGLHLQSGGKTGSREAAKPRRKARSREEKIMFSSLRVLRVFA